MFIVDVGRRQSYKTRVSSSFTTITVVVKDLIIYIRASFFFLHEVRRNVFVVMLSHFFFPRTFLTLIYDCIHIYGFTHCMNVSSNVIFFNCSTQYDDDRFTSSFNRVLTTRDAVAEIPDFFLWFFFFFLLKHSVVSTPSPKFHQEHAVRLATTRSASAVRRLSRPSGGSDSTTSSELIKLSGCEGSVEVTKTVQSRV